METKKDILLIMGSVRLGRRCPPISAWVAEIGGKRSDYNYQIVDLADWPLPMNDEPVMPALGEYRQPHTQAWSQKISTAAAVIIVTPEYNGGYPAVLKNAIDHIYKEWNDKPTLLLTYGGHGGKRCAEQLRQVAGVVKMRLVPTSPALALPTAVSREGAALEPEQHFQDMLPVVEQALDELIASIA